MKKINNGLNLILNVLFNFYSFNSPDKIRSFNKKKIIEIKYMFLFLTFTLLQLIIHRRMKRFHFP